MTQDQDCECCIDPNLDELLAVLSSWRRRCVVYHLEKTEDNVASVQALAGVLADYGPETGDDRGPAILYHKTLPRLDDLGIVEYDARSDDVRYRPGAVPERVLDCLKTAEWGE